MSSLRNVVRRREHKERAQPRKRARKGLLEKHKDYVLRARDYHSKERRIKALERKAYFRNQDEFYFGMVNSQTEVGFFFQTPRTCHYVWLVCNAQQ
jgi:U3 small nucleolar RNA-associated protein 11